jgi:hypothetical protein
MQNIRGGGRRGTGYTVPLVALILKGILNASKAVGISDKPFKMSVCTKTTSSL